MHKNASLATYNFTPPKAGSALWALLCATCYTCTLLATCEKLYGELCIHATSNGQSDHFLSDMIMV